MSEKERDIIQELAEKLPGMSEREKGYLEGTIATAAAMSKKQQEEAEADNDKEKTA